MFEFVNLGTMLDGLGQTIFMLEPGRSVYMFALVYNYTVVNSIAPYWKAYLHFLSVTTVPSFYLLIHVWYKFVEKNFPISTLGIHFIFSLVLNK